MAIACVSAGTRDVSITEASVSASEAVKDGKREAACAARSAADSEDAGSAGAGPKGKEAVRGEAVGGEAADSVADNEEADDSEADDSEADDGVIDDGASSLSVIGAEWMDGSESIADISLRMNKIGAVPDGKSGRKTSHKVHTRRRYAREKVAKNI